MLISVRHIFTHLSLTLRTCQCLQMCCSLPLTSQKFELWSHLLRFFKLSHRYPPADPSYLSSVLQPPVGQRAGLNCQWWLAAQLGLCLTRVWLQAWPPCRGSRPCLPLSLFLSLPRHLLITALWEELLQLLGHISSHHHPVFSASPLYRVPDKKTCVIWTG